MTQDKKSPDYRGFSMDLRAVEREGLPIALKADIVTHIVVVLPMY